MRYINGQRTMFVYDAAGQLAAEYDGTPPVYPVCATCYLSADQLGSTRLVTNQNINVVERHDYLPFGEEIQANQGGRTSAWGVNDLIAQRFTGKERDSESGLDYFGARYYGSALGRFTSPDEFKGGIVDPFTGQDIETNTALPYADITDPQTLNKYAYVRNNPLRYTDPNGHCVEALTCTVEFGTAGAEIGSLGGPIGTAAGALIGGAIGAFTGYEIYKGAQAVVSLATNNISSQQGQPAAAPSGQASGSKSAEEMASDLKDKIGKNSVPYDTPSSKGRIDLAGKGHFDKATGQVVDTPHVQEGTKSVGPNGEVNIGNKTVRPATKQDIRTAEKLAKQKGWLQE
jgi:RHS repeat-associated protein